MAHRNILILLGLGYLASTNLAIFNVLNQNFSGISWILIPLGIFIWGDGLILGPFMTIGIIWLWSKNSKVWTGLFLSTFAAIRSLIEIIYSLNAQFSSITRPWELNWRDFRLYKVLV